MCCGQHFILLLITQCVPCLLAVMFYWRPLQITAEIPD